MKKDLSNLPTADKPTGMPPDASPYFAPILAERWMELALADDHKDMAFPEARTRHSWAGMCARKISYMMTDTPKSNPGDIGGFWVMGLGTLIHERWQEALLKQFPDAEVEKKVFIDESKSAGHIDAQVGSTVIELKSIGGFGFKMAVGARGPAEGPRTGAIMQASLNALAVDADQAVVIDLATENCSAREAAKLGPEPWRKFAAEWTFDREAYQAYARPEVKRLARIIELVDAGTLAPRSIPHEIPAGARITDPMTGTWQLVEGNLILEAGSYWGCASYCDWRDQCVADGA